MRVRERLCVELAGIRRDWEAWCARRGVTAGEGVRQLITVALDTDDRDSDPHVETTIQASVVRDSRKRIEVRLTCIELHAVEQRASAFGLTSNRWVVALIRAQLTREPQLGELELRLLSESNQHLATISRWLAQLARTRTAAPPTRDERPDETCIRQHIDIHLRTVAAVIRANLDRWSR
jgi:predicted DNA binding CopG/RHH family protein